MPVAGQAERVVRGVGLRARVWRHRGDAVRCPVCEHGFDRFADDVHGVPVVCWRCGAHARHRAMWLLWQVRPELVGGASSLLHFAPEWGLRHQLERRSGLRYVTTDLAQPDVDVHLDVTALELPDGAFDAVVCSHVLEHVADDAAAMRELRRVTAAGGWCLVMTPLTLTRGDTYEDPAIVAPQERRRAFSGAEHVRLYAVDIADRLTAAGFAVERIDPRAALGENLCRRCAIADHEIVWLCRPARVDAGQPA